MNATRLLLILVALWLIAPSLNAATIQVQADRNPVGQDESFQLTFSSAESPDGDPDFSPLEPLVDILNRSQHSNISVINGLYQSTKSWTLTLMPKKRGKLILPSISFGRDKSPPYELMVQGAVVRKEEQTEMFTRIDFDQRKLFVNQQLVVTHTLFSATNLTSYDLGELKFSGVDAVVEPLGDAKQYTKMIGQKPFLVIEQPYAVFPLGAGTMKLDMVVSSAEQAMTRGSFYLPFGGAPKILRARTGGRQIEVMPPPADADMNPWLPAKSLDLSERWDQSPLKFVVGEPVTRTLTLKAEGLAAAQLPDLSKIKLDGIKLYPDQPLLNDIKNDNGISGYSVQKIAFIPIREGIIELPAIEIAWWNTRSNQREVARVAAQTIEVLPAAANALSVAPAQAEPMEEAPAAELENDTGTVEPEQQLLPVTTNTSPWFFISMLLTFGWLLTLLAWYFKSGNKVAAVRRKADVDTKKLLKQARRGLIAACDTGNPGSTRVALLDWARLHFDRPDLTMGDAYGLLPPGLVEQLRLIDAVLYGGVTRDIDYQSIKKGVEAMARQGKIQPSSDIAGLEPMYRG